MKILNYKQMACVIAALLLASCASDEITEGTEQNLPKGKYPLQIASVSLTTESTAEPWSANAPKTRVSENDNKCVWTNGDKIATSIGDDPKLGTFIVNVDESGNVTGLTAENVLYWQDTTAQIVKGWYPQDAFTSDVDLQSQSGQLAYILYAETTTPVNYKATNIELTFTQQLAKIRIAFKHRSLYVNSVQVFTYPGCLFNPTKTIITGIDTPQYINMQENAEGYWEANVVPGYTISKVKVNDVECQLTTPVTPVAGQCHVITITVN